jgi:hypothetical protein
MCRRVMRRGVPSSSGWLVGLVTQGPLGTTSVPGGMILRKVLLSKPYVTSVTRTGCTTSLGISISTASTSG